MGHLCTYLNQNADKDFATGLETSAEKASDFIEDGVSEILRGSIPDSVSDDQLLKLCLIVNQNAELCEEIRNFRQSLICRFNRLEIRKFKWRY